MNFLEDPLLKSSNAQPHSTNHCCYVHKSWKVVQRVAYPTKAEEVTPF